MIKQPLMLSVVAMSVFLVCCVPGDCIAEDDVAVAAANADTEKDVLPVPDAWVFSAPLILPEQREVEPSAAQKDPTVVRHNGYWHVFMTVKLPTRSAIEYCSFRDWKDANAARRYLLPLSDSSYFCAPQVFFFRPHGLWYLVYQVGVPGQKKMWVAYSTTRTISDPSSWTPARPILDGGPLDERVQGGLDYWVICDDEHAWLFFTSLNGRMWRMKTSLSEFPQGFHDCTVALQADIFEASHTYRVAGRQLYLTIVEQKGRRFFKAYVADRLDGKWRPLRDTEQRPFAGAANIRPAAGVEPWTDNVSHGELIRASNDERLLIDPNQWQFVFQGMLEKEKRGRGYGRYSWRIGLLTPAER